MAETPSDTPEKARDPAGVPDKEQGLRRIQAEREVRPRRSRARRGLDRCPTAMLSCFLLTGAVFTRTA
jgi:hypothetical protein